MLHVGDQRSQPQLVTSSRQIGQCGVRLEHGVPGPPDLGNLTEVVHQPQRSETRRLGRLSHGHQRRPNVGSAGIGPEVKAGDDQIESQAGSDTAHRRFCVDRIRRLFGQSLGDLSGRPGIDDNQIEALIGDLGLGLSPLFQLAIENGLGQRKRTLAVAVVAYIRGCIETNGNAVKTVTMGQFDV